MEASREPEHSQIDGDDALYSLIADDLADCEVEVETAGDLIQGWIAVESENPFTVRVGDETIFASDIWQIRSIETDEVWAVRGVTGIIDTHYRPDRIRELEQMELSENDLPEAGEVRERSQRKESGEKRETRPQKPPKGEPTMPRDLDAFVKKFTERARQVRLVLTSDQGPSERVVFVVGAHIDTNGWQLVVLEAGKGKESELVPYEQVDMQASEYFVP